MIRLSPPRRAVPSADATGPAARPAPSAPGPAPARRRSAHGHGWRLLALALLLPLRTSAQPSVTVQDSAAPLLIEARDAARKRDAGRLSATRALLDQHALRPWVDYWDLSARLRDASADEIAAFYARWPGTYVEDRLRNDWLLELGRRRDFDGIAREYPRFRMNDDREVRCWWLLGEHRAGRDVTDAGRRAWWGQRSPDEGCQSLAEALVGAERLDSHDIWRKAVLAMEAQSAGGVRAALRLLGPRMAAAADDVLDRPAKVLARSIGFTQNAHELRLLAFMRLASQDLPAALDHLQADRLALPRAAQAQALAYAARQAVFRSHPDAPRLAQRAAALLPSVRPDAGQPQIAASTEDLGDETLGWTVRGLLRAPLDTFAADSLLRVIQAMSPEARQADAAWPYWAARAWQLRAADSGLDASARDPMQARARSLWQGIVDGAGAGAAVAFYPLLAAEALGLRPTLPADPPPLTADERQRVRQHPGLQRGLLATQIGLRSEGVREWNFSLRDLDERGLLAAARWACEQADWQLCINTAERTRSQVDLALRYPAAWRDDIRSAARQAGLDPALVAGLIRQETRFMMSLRSSVGATGLMQLMPETGRWTARKLGIAGYSPEQLSDPALNLRLGTTYLRLVMDDLDGSAAMGAAAYNAGPGRPRRWREAATVDAEAWTEAIPLAETRDYVKKVLSNAAVYAALADPGRPAPDLRTRLGRQIAPRAATAAPSNTALP
ncbi:MAG: hypothetical protein RIQ53_2551 [Pseudomonadota bacterium]